MFKDYVRTKVKRTHKDRKDIGIHLNELKEIMEIDSEELIENVMITGGQITNIRFQGLQKNNSLYLTRNLTHKFFKNLI